MELLSEEEIKSIAKKRGFSKVVKWRLEDFSNKVIGYLGEHIKLFVDVEENGTSSTINLFVKCLPRFDTWKADRIRETGFFYKEYVMLSELFNEFGNGTGYRKWRPELLFIKENVFVFENVSFSGYVMPHHQDTMSFEELKASVETLARFHAQSYIYEERKTKQLGRPYRIWEDYSKYLKEPTTNDWRDIGRNAVIDYLKVYSKYKSEPNFNRYLESIIPELFSKSLELMQPSTEYRNAVVHRDLWSNNILMKKEPNAPLHVMFVDFQTVIYTSPLLDLSSLIYFNTSRRDRDKWTEDFIDIYYAVLSDELEAAGINVNSIFEKDSLRDAYEKGRLFGITQAAVITPIIALSKEKGEQLFCDPESFKRINEVTRSQEFIDFAKEDDKYRVRVTELFDEIVERYVFPKLST